MPKRDPFYRNTNVDAVRRVASDVANLGEECQAVVMIVNADGSARVRIRGSNKTTPASIARGLDIGPKDYVLMRRNGQGRWIICDTYGAPAQFGETHPKGYGQSATRNASNDTPAVAPGGLSAQGGPAMLMIWWTPPGTRGDSLFDVQIADDAEFSSGLEEYRVAGTTLSVASTPEVDRYIRVRTINGNWTQSGWSDAVVRAALVSGSGGGVGGASAYVLIQDHKSQNTSGGTAPSGWFTRDLNTLVNDTTGAVSLASNEFTLPTGTWDIYVEAPGWAIGRSQIRLFNVTDNVTEIWGSSKYGHYAPDSTLFGKFTVTGPTTFRVEQKVEAPGGGGGLGLGVEANFSGEIYTTVRLTSADAGTPLDPLVIQDDGSDQPVRGHLNITGAVTVTDDALNNATIVNFGTPFTPPTDNSLYILIRDEKSPGTQGGTFNTGAWQQRDLNTIVNDSTGFVTLVSNQFTLRPGTYRVAIRCPGHAVGYHQARLYNVTDSAEALIGSSEYSSPQPNDSVILGSITLTAQKTFEVQHRCSSSHAPDGFGPGGGYASKEIYTEVLLTYDGKIGLDLLALDFDSSTGSSEIIGSVYDDQRAIRVRVVVATAFDGTPSLTVGDSGDNDRLVLSTDVDLSLAGIYEVVTDYIYSGAIDVVLYFSDGGCTVGDGEVVVELKA